MVEEKNDELQNLSPLRNQIESAMREVRKGFEEAFGKHPNEDKDVAWVVAEDVLKELLIGVILELGEGITYEGVPIFSSGELPSGAVYLMRQTAKNEVEN